MSTTTVSGTGKRNNGSTILNAGNVPTEETGYTRQHRTRDTNPSSLGSRRWGQFNKPTENATATETEGATVANRGGTPGVITAKGSGTFAYNNQRGVIKRVNTKINNVANTTLQSGGVGKGARTNSAIGGVEEYHPLPHYSYNADGSILAKVASPGGVDAATGWDSSTNYIDPATAGGTTASTDSAANPTRAIPGELVYRDASPSTNTNNTGLGVPKQDNYKAKTG